MSTSNLYAIFLSLFSAFLSVLCVSFSLGVVGYFGGALCFIPIIVLAINITNAFLYFVISFSMKPVHLAKLSIEDTDDSLRTLVVIPCLLSNHEIIDRLITSLKEHYYNNSLSHLGFALLTDFKDADHQKMPTDEVLLHYAVEKIEALNRELSNCFALLHRNRVWAQTEHQWIGQERKRGKLENLNQFLLTDEQTLFSGIFGSISILKGVRFVVTVDADTQLPPRSVLSLIATIADEHNFQYDLIQPTIHPVKDEPKNVYQWLMFPLFASVRVSQEIFGRGRYVGKGIYDVKKVHHKLVGTMPTGWVLSHDILESCIINVGACDEVCVYERSPATYGESVSIFHRWHRGDWQVLPWVLPLKLRRKLSEFNNIREINMTWVERWMLLECMLRSLQTPALFLLLMIFAMMGHGFYMFVSIVCIDLLITMLSVVSQIIRGGAFLLKFTLVRILARLIFSIGSLPTSAYMSFNAISKAIYRMFISKAHRLEWMPSTEWKITNNRFTTLGFLAPNFVSALFLLGLFELSYAAHSVFTLILATMWCMFPVCIKPIEQCILNPRLVDNEV